MGGDAPLSGLSFDIVLEIFPDSSLIWQFWANTVNWLSTNLQGMTFGVLFGAAILTLLSLLQKRSFENGFANAAMGAAIGAPLGVCVNCAAPIAVGLHAGRMRLETTLSALLASPTLNVIVVTMSFALLPFHIAAIKLLVALFVVLLGVPLLCQFILKEETLASGKTPASFAMTSKPSGLTGWIGRILAPQQAVAGSFRLPASAIWLFKTYARNFFFIFVVTVPTMILAALLGSLVTLVTYPTAMAHMLPAGDVVLILAALVAIALVASFVPAPIALDVILVVILMGIGLKSHYAETMLIALGSYSVYVFIILWRAISPRTALAVWGMVIFASLAGGVAAYFAGQTDQEFELAGHRETLNQSNGINWPNLPATSPAIALSQLKPSIREQTIPTEPVRFAQDQPSGRSLRIERLSDTNGPAQPKSDGAIFSRLTGSQIGLDEPDAISALGKSIPYGMRGGIAAGDVHGDNWPDIVVRRSALTTGLSLFANIGGEFKRQTIDLGPVEEYQVLNVALVDIDGDSSLDLVASTLGHGNYVFYNQAGEFSWQDATRLPNPGANTSFSFAFADMDKDGDIDIVQGNWSVPLANAGPKPGWAFESGHNNIAWNLGARKFDAERISHQPGQTLTLLIHDVDDDGYPDVINGDDVASTDGITYFDADGKFSRRGLDGQIFPYMMDTSMGYDEGDWNNDLQSDFYGSQMSRLRGSGREIVSIAMDLCSQFSVDRNWNNEKRNRCIREFLSTETIGGGYNSRVFGTCKRTDNQAHRLQCAASSILQIYDQRRTVAPDKELHAECTKQLRKFPKFILLCDSLLDELKPKPSKDELERTHVPALRSANLLMTSGADKKLTDLADEQGVARLGTFSWNGNFADLDQDGWQDLMVMTGIWLMPASTRSNVFYRNDAGRFIEKTDEFGFTDIIPSFSHITLDYDLDGDVDVIRGLSGLDMIVHRNDRSVGRGLWVSLRDSKGNVHGIGARVIICTDGTLKVEQGRCQRRSIRASGGYMSFNPIEAHFGLGQADKVSLIEIRWPDGEVDTLLPDDLRDGRIVISRD